MSGFGGAAKRVEANLVEAVVWKITGSGSKPDFPTKTVTNS